MIRKFDLNEYLANPDLHVVTRCGMPVRIVCTDVKSYKQPILGLLYDINTSSEIPQKYMTDGKVFKDYSDKYDLLFDDEHKKYHVCLFRDVNNHNIVYTRIADTADVLKEYKADPDFVECKVFEI